MTFRIGTRGSLLASTQATLVKEELEQLSGEKFELVFIKTQGDQIVDRPLWQLEGKDFFTKELDEALLKEEVDLVIHSYKDLGSDRPNGIALGAITRRDYAHDILLIKKTTIEKLKSGLTSLKLGTSSPRRITNLTHFLSDFLPHQGKLTIDCVTLRGNVNTRIKKLKEDQYDGITLALAGLERLCGKDDSKKELTELLNDLSFMVLPLSAFPSAAAQGALAIEYNHQAKNAEKIKSILDLIHHSVTAQEVSRERKAFQSYGGGCHLAVGIHVRKFEDDFLHFHRGEKDHIPVELKASEKTNLIGTITGNVFIGIGKSKKTKIINDRWFQKNPLRIQESLDHSHVFVTSKHAEHVLTSHLKDSFLWSAGVMTWKNLANKGFWVYGSADSMGSLELKKLLSSRALALMIGSSKPVKVLSHDKAQSDLGSNIATYSHSFTSLSETDKKELETVSHFYWSSIWQYRAYVTALPTIKEKKHFCGLGKTYSEFKKNQIPVTALINHEQLLLAL